MLSEALRKAREFEAQYLPYISDAERPAFHVTGGIGWINDPNGFSVYQGKYHLFYQYHPYSNQWGPMHWGHVVTDDFIRWERLPVALAPDTEYDRGGCFSGSAVEMDDGRHLLMYTGVHHVRREDGLMQEYQTQCVAIGDGVDYVKYEGNPVLTGANLPEGGSALDFRDPKIWREPNGLYRAVVGNRTEDGSGAIRLFESADGLHWSYAATIDRCHNEFGRMWECPDFFPLDGKQVLLTSPQEMAALGLEFHAGYGTICLTGDWDSEQRRFDRQRVQAIDYGIDFYAPQTLLAPDGRRIMIAWMQSWSNTHCQIQGEQHYFGEMTLPRELSLRNGRLTQNPVRELERYHGHRVAYEGVLVDRETNMPGVSGRILDMTVTVRPAGAMYQWFKLNLAKDGEFATTIRYKPLCNTVRVDRSRCGLRYDVVHVRDFLVRPNNGEIKLRVVMDRHSLELFVNDGEQAATFIVYTPETADSISFEAEGSALVDVEKYELNF